MIWRVAEWKDHFHSLSTSARINQEAQHETEYKRIVWATNFQELLRLSSKERSLKQSASVTYKRPPNLSNLLTNYKVVAHSNPTGFNNGSSLQSGKCGLCCNHGNLKNMVNCTTKLITPEGTFSLKNIRK